MAAASPSPDLWPRTTRFLPWSIAAFLAMLYLIPFDAMVQTSAKLDRPLLGLALVAWLISLALLRGDNRPRLSGTVLHGAILLFVLLAVASILLNASTLHLHAELTLGLKKLVVLICFAILFVITASALRPREARAFMPLIVGLGCVAAAGTIWEYRTGYNPFYEIGGKLIPGGLELPPISHELDATGRTIVLGPTIHPLADTQLLAMTVPFAIVGGLHASTRARKIAYLVATFVLLAGVFSTQRKTGPVVIGVGLLTLVAYRPRQMMRLAPLGIPVLLAIPFIAPSALGSLRDQFSLEGSSRSVSSRDRTSDYEAIGPDILNHPALGRGWQTYDPERYRVLDNEYLSILIGTGWLGIGAYLLWLVAAFMVCGRAIRTNDPARAPPALAAASATAIMAVGSATFDAMAFSVIPYLFCFFLALAATCAPRPALRPAPDGLDLGVPVQRAGSGA